MQQVLTNNKKFFILAIGIILALGIGILMYRPTNSSSTVINEQSQKLTDETINYSCNQGRSVSVQFAEQHVTVKTSDNDVYTMKQIESASGMKFATDSEDIIFWSKGETALVEEFGEVTFVNCIEMH